MAVELTLIGKAAGRRKTRLTEEVRICWSRCEHGCARRALALSVSRRPFPNASDRQWMSLLLGRRTKPDES